MSEETDLAQKNSILHMCIFIWIHNLCCHTVNYEYVFITSILLYTSSWIHFAVTDYISWP